MAHQRGKIVFTGDFWEYFFKALLLLFASAITFGVLVPYWIYWNVRYFAANVEIEIPDDPAAVRR